eukprot:1811991-Rhodomonas_salina.3
MRNLGMRGRRRAAYMAHTGSCMGRRCTRRLDRSLLATRYAGSARKVRRVHAIVGVRTWDLAGFAKLALLDVMVVCAVRRPARASTRNSGRCRPHKTRNSFTWTRLNGEGEVGVSHPLADNPLASVGARLIASRKRAAPITAQRTNGALLAASHLTVCTQHWVGRCSAKTVCCSCLAPARRDSPWCQHVSTGHGQPSANQESEGLPPCGHVRQSSREAAPSEGLKVLAGQREQRSGDAAPLKEPGSAARDLRTGHRIVHTQAGSGPTWSTLGTACAAGVGTLLASTALLPPSQAQVSPPPLYTAGTLRGTTQADRLPPMSGIADVSHGVGHCTAKTQNARGTWALHTEPLTTELTTTPSSHTRPGNARRCQYRAPHSERGREGLAVTRGAALAVIAGSDHILVDVTQAAVLGVVAPRSRARVPPLPPLACGRAVPWAERILVAERAGAIEAHGSNRTPHADRGSLRGRQVECALTNTALDVCVSVRGREGALGARPALRPSRRSGLGVVSVCWAPPARVRAGRVLVASCETRCAVNTARQKALLTQTAGLALLQFVGHSVHAETCGAAPQFVHAPADLPLGSWHDRSDCC